MTPERSQVSENDPDGLKVSATIGIGSRRPIASRNARWAQALARRIAATRITPNQISVASVAVAAVTGAALWASAYAPTGASLALLLLAATGCQLRLICNLMDGLVAIESGKRSPDGPFWNEFPDRIADILIIVGLGLGAGTPALGWAAASLAVLTAYIRELGHTCGAPVDFSGPMAKPHRMAVATLAALATGVERLMAWPPTFLEYSLWLLAAGAALTSARRAARIVRHLHATASG